MKKLIIGNWKANKDEVSTSAWFEKFARLANFDVDQVEVVVAPPFNLLSIARQKIDELALPIKLAVQDLSPMPTGSYTGEVAAGNLHGLRVEYAILGHSERRRYFLETDHLIANKVEMACLANIKPVLCLDEPYLMTQSRAIKKELLPECVVAYEPLSAIGSGDNASISEVTSFKDRLYAVCGEVDFIYGGSVNADNVNQYLLVSRGVLVGGASLDATNFAELIRRSVVQNE
ncbi:MAG: triose-phosphate isomerase [Patescibacteria group bacterium]